MKAIFDAFGVKVNEITAEALFDRYRQLGFLYPNKLKALAPYMDLVLDNWRKAMSGDPELFRVLTYDQNDTWGSITSWLTTTGGVHSQHLVSSGKPQASCAVMLAEQWMGIQNSIFKSGQNWFQPTNRYATRVFATAAHTMGSHASNVETYSYVAVPLRGIPSATGPVALVSGINRSQAIVRLAHQTRGQVYAQAEEFDHQDIGLDALDQRYRKIGLRRYRRVWLASLPRFSDPVGAVVAYRGPLGFNFSFLENRCDVLIQDGLTPEEEQRILFHLLKVAASVYQDFPPAYIPVVIDAARAPYLLQHGASLIRLYAQSVWLRPGFRPWYDHVESLYRRVKKNSGQTQGVGRKSPHPPQEVEYV